MPVTARRDGRDLVAGYAGRLTRFTCARDGDVCWLGRDGHAWALREAEAFARRASAQAAAAGALRSPMPGTVQAVKVGEGDHVTAGQPLVVIEAMKMEHTVVAPAEGVVTAVPVRAGAQVAMDELLAVVSPEADP